MYIQHIYLIYQSGVGIGLVWTLLGTGGLVTASFC
jgi:hypothetical protein